MKTRKKTDTKLCTDITIILKETPTPKLHVAIKLCNIALPLYFITFYNFTFYFKWNTHNFGYIELNTKIMAWLSVLLFTYCSNSDENVSHQWHGLPFFSTNSFHCAWTGWTYNKKRRSLHAEDLISFFLPLSYP